MKIIAAVLLVAACQVNAETVYKYVAPDGSVTYSNDPITGSTPSKSLTLDPATNIAQPPPAIVENDPSERLQELQAWRQAREKERVEVVLAQQALEAAEAALVAGREPLPGERRGACVANGTSGGNCMTVNANGMTVQGNFTSRLIESYDDRIARLEADVERAKARLQEALAKERGF
ncbi:MAG: DUF4124 domain-containing protein [Burkholderiales bacterium]